MKATISVDMDTLNDYANTYSIKYLKNPDPSYTIAIQRLLDLLNKYNIKATFFVIGKDLNVKEHLKIIRLIKNQGHEIANHTQNHFIHFEKLSDEDQKQEILECHKLVKEKLGIDMKGFRAPGYNLNTHTFETLAKNNYFYDSSIFPTILLPVFKMAIIMRSRGKFKSSGGGKIKNVFSKDSPYLIKKLKLLEIPISVTPVFKLPFMGTFNVVAGEELMKLNLWLLKAFSKDINYEIHPIEFLDFTKDRIPKEFSRHPGISIPLNKKIKLYKSLFKSFKDNYDIVTMYNFSKQFLV